MPIFKNTASLFFSFVLSICQVKATEKTESEHLNGVNVYFDVQKSGSWLTLIAKESGTEKFRAQIADSGFSTFTGSMQNNFNIRRLGSDLAWQYRNYSGELFEILIKRNGDVALLDTIGTDTGFSRSRTYGVKTSGTLENRGNQAFHFLVASAKQIHNFGTIQSYTVQFYQNYLYNSGYMEFGRIPTVAMDLRTPLPRTPAPASYKQYVIENYGRFISHGRFTIKDALNYHEYGTSDFDDLDIHWGDINIKRGGTNNINGTLMGGVRDLTIEADAALTAERVNIYPIRNVRVDNRAILHSTQKMDLVVNGTYSLSGSITSDDSLNLTLKQVASPQSGILYAPNGVVCDTDRAALEQMQRMQRDQQQREQAERAVATRQRLEAEREVARLKEELSKLEKEKQEQESLVGVPITTYESEGYVLGRDGVYKHKRRHGMTFSLGFGTGGVSFSGRTRGTAPLPGLTREQLNARFDPLFSRNRSLLQESMARVRTYQSIESRPIYTTTPIRREQVKPGVVYTRSQESERPVVETKQRLQTALVRLTGERERIEREHQFWDGLKTSMTRSGIPSTDIQTIFTDKDVTAVLHNLRNYNQTLTSVVSLYTGTLQRLARDSELDKPWWSRDFTSETAVTFIRSQTTNPLEDYIFKHPEFLLGPASLAVKGVSTAGALVLERVAPKFLAVGVTGRAWESFASYMKGGKESVTQKATAERSSLEYGKGKHWDGLITDRTSATSAGVKPKDIDTILGRIQRAKREIKGASTIRADAQGRLYRFDEGHRSSKVHLELIEEQGGKFWGKGEVCPETGEVNLFPRSEWRMY